MDERKTAKRLSNILPESPDSANRTFGDDREVAINQAAKEIVDKKASKELAKIKYREARKKQQLEEKKQELEAAGVEPGRTLHQQRMIEEQERKLEVLEAIAEDEASSRPAVVRNKILRNSPKEILALQGTTRHEVVKLLASLNINLNLQLTKQDTMNILACLLTCNEAQLSAIYNNKKVPVVIKTVIKRLLDDAKLGNIDTVERLWDRIFGKAGMLVNLPQEQQLATGIIPNTPVSREAYLIIRDTLIK